MTSAPAIGFEYRPSRWLIRLLFLVAFASVLAMWVSAVPWLVKLIGTAVVATVFWRTRLRLSASPIEAAGWARDGGWSLRIRAGEDTPATLSSFRVVGESIVWLRLSLPERRYALVLLAQDNSDADIRRRLRMRLAQIEASGTLAAERGPTV
jgi:toxin CptA